MDNEGNDDTLITLTADIVAAHVSNNSVAVNDLPQLIANVHNALNGLGAKPEEAPVRPEPAVSVRSSINILSRCAKCTLFSQQSWESRMETSSAFGHAGVRSNCRHTS